MRGKLLGTFLLIAALAAPAGARPARDFAGHWVGTWKGGTSHDTYKPDMRLADDGNGELSGAITWTLVKAGMPDQRGKEGMTGVEFVRGHVDGGELVLDGVNLKDPNHILGRDAYRLVLSDNGRVLGGITSNGGSWSGYFRAERK